jgi:hypothetical protein
MILPAGSSSRWPVGSTLALRFGSGSKALRLPTPLTCAPSRIRTCDLLLRRTLHCLPQPACSQAIGRSGCARVAVSAPWIRPAVARVWHAVGPARCGRTISLGMSAAGRSDQPFRGSAGSLDAPPVTVNLRVRPTHRAGSGHGDPFLTRSFPSSVLPATVPPTCHAACPLASLVRRCCPLVVARIWHGGRSHDRRSAVNRSLTPVHPTCN